MKIGTLLSDLKYDPKTNNQKMTPQRAFTLCELAIYRFRDYKFEPEAREYETLSLLAEEIQDLAKSWSTKGK